MENKIDIAELLRDCPKGMELDCTVLDNIVFDGVSNWVYPIKVITKDGSKRLNLTKYGCTSENKNAKCVIFPKGKTTWEGFHRPFKDGDILAEDSCIFIIQKLGDNSTAAKTYCTLYNNGDFDDGTILYFDIDNTKLATEEEKQKLFQAIKAKGYHWNAETKTLEKLSKFKVGDTIRHKSNGVYCKLGEYSEGISAYRTNIGLSLTYKDLEQWELAPNKFDVTTLKPFDKVLVKTDNESIWSIQFFEKLNNLLKKSFICMGGVGYRQCIPYKGNEHLLNTDNKPDNFYITWENEATR